MLERQELTLQELLMQDKKARRGVTQVCVALYLTHQGLANLCFEIRHQY
jgi:hypothetical protein